MKSSFAFCLFVGLVGAAGISLAGCSDDEEDGDATGGSSASSSSGSGGSGAASSSSSGAGGDGATGGEGTGGEGEGGGGGEGEGGAGGGGNGMAAAFCAEYDEKCGFGGQNHWASEQECITGYTDANPNELDCWETHLDNVGAEPDIHCEHAAGFNCPG